MAKKGLEMSLAQARQHASKHGYSLDGDADHIQGRPGQEKRVQGHSGALLNPQKAKKDRMTRPEREMGLILEAQKRAGEILEYRFEGISLAWGIDPKTGKAMRYKPDFWVHLNPTFEHSEHLFDRLPVRLIECKGPRIWPQDFIRFKGARACWPRFEFELWQRGRDGTWARLE